MGLTGFLQTQNIIKSLIPSFQVLELEKRLEAARSQIRDLPGINYNKEEQLKQLENLRNQLSTKQKLIKKYRNLQL